MVGTVTGAAIPFFLLFLSLFGSLVAFGPLHEETLAKLWFALFSVAFVFVIVALSSLLIGLPVTWSLRRLDAESLKAYSIAGGVAGALIPFIPLAFSGGPWSGVLLALGCLSGTATARTWWHARRAGASHAPPIDGQA